MLPECVEELLSKAVVLFLCASLCLLIHSLPTVCSVCTSAYMTLRGSECLYGYACICVDVQYKYEFTCLEVYMRKHLCECICVWMRVDTVFVSI